MTAIPTYYVHVIIIQEKIPEMTHTHTHITIKKFQEEDKYDAKL